VAELSLVLDGMGATRWCSWLRHCATSQRVVGLIPDGVIGIFHWHNPSGCTMALGLTQPLTEMSTRNISWGVKAANAYGWQPYYLQVPIVLKSGSLKLLEPSGPAQACNGIALPLPFTGWYEGIQSHLDPSCLVFCCREPCQPEPLKPRDFKLCCQNCVFTTDCFCRIISEGMICNWTLSWITSRKAEMGAKKQSKNNFFLFTFVPCILIISKFFIHQRMHKWSS